MQFIVKAYDGEGMLDKRMEVRPRHLEGIERIKEHVICAGGLLDDEGKMKGSVLIIGTYNKNYCCPLNMKSQFEAIVVQ